MGRLVRNVLVDGSWWGPSFGNADQVPDEVAAKVTNPTVWAAPDAADTVFPLLPADPREQAETGGPAPAGLSPPEDLDLDVLDRGQLLAVAQERGLDVHPLLGEKRLRALLADGGAP